MGIQSMKKPIIGAQLYSLRDSCRTLADTARTLDRVRGMGYSVVQLSSVRPMDDDPVGLARVLRDSGISACCTHVPLDSILADPAREIARHEEWGVRHVAIGSCPTRYPLTLAGVRDLAKDFAKASESLAEAGMDLSYHNHRFEFVHVEDGRTFLRAFYDSLPPSILKAELDVAWVAAGGASPAMLIRSLGVRQPLIHLKDYVLAQTYPEDPSRRNETFDYPVAVGSGNLDWPDILAAAEEANVEYALVELDSARGGDPFAEMAKSREYLYSLGY